MYLAILALPLLGGLIGVNRKCGLKGGPILSVICIVLTAILSTIAFIEVGLNGSPVSIKLGYWIESLYLNVEWGLVYDSLTVSMLIPVIYVSALVQIYSMGYMESDPHLPRFFSYLSLFSFFMLILVTGENLLVLFLGWEGVGVASYLLINFWYTRMAANFAALKAFLINRVGDWALTLGILLAIGLISDLSMASIFSVASYLNGDLVFILTIFLLIGATAKSAQLGLHTWLASAMEGPTPVSALIHAATMVTAGVYLLMRISPLLEWSSTTLIVVTWLGGLSALLGAACGLLENDLKRVIAFSTTSQLGYMVVACGLSQYSLALFHLCNHAFFKALLFLSAGAVIHALADQQDMRKMGGLVLLLPKTYSFILLGSLSLMAFPFLTGFYSKDYLLEMALVPRNATTTIAYILALVAAILTATYSARLMILTFLSAPHYPHTVLETIADPPLLMLIPLLILGFGAAFFGFLTHELFLGLGSTFYQQALFTHPSNLTMLDGPLSPPSLLKFLPPATLLILLTLLPISKPLRKLTSLPFSITSTFTSTIPHYHSLSYYTSFLNHFNIFNHWTMHNTLNFANNVFRYWDRGLVELLGPMGLVRLIHYFSFKLELLATGFIPHYAFLIIFIPFISAIIALFSLPASLILLFIYLFLAL
uniref:NADH-ubiquinone oxidoreductase chain 5 n=1 Tax=Spizellomyces punctatus TaxID=109760 RepID=Q950Q5_SPIPN|nr:NADH dehydrogenase subunit 5 [Spizellomyces punctatus]AAK84253.1 NADH dehydrogenase subunit 5 [Spizellomyces punctatus]